MVELREQLGALLRLEVTYATKDYLEGLTARSKDCDSSTSRNGNGEGVCFFTTLEDQVVPPGVGDKISNDESLPSTAASTSGSNTVITEQRAVSWREKICEWAYQGEQKASCDISHLP